MQKITFRSLIRPLSSKRVTAVQRKFYPVTWRNSYVIVLLAAAGLSSGWAASTYLILNTYILVSVVFAFIIAFAIIVQVSWAREMRLRTESTLRKIRHEDFAKENDLEYIEKIVQPRYSGIVFTSTINTPTAYDVFRFKEENGVEVGNYRFMAEESPGTGIQSGGYIRLRLERRVAHMLLNGCWWYGGILDSDFDFNSQQWLGLEGDFDEYFSLYAPKEYERDALYIFTPDFMALLIDQAKYADEMKHAGISIEVIEDELYIYSATFDLTDPQTWKMIVGLISAIGTKTASRTDLYSDDKVMTSAVNTIAKGGQRLERITGSEKFWLYVSVWGSLAGFIFILRWLLQLE